MDTALTSLAVLHPPLLPREDGTDLGGGAIVLVVGRCTTRYGFYAV